MILVNQTPARPNAQKSSLSSKWLGSVHPILFNMQRVDYYANSAQNDGLGNLKFTVISNTGPDFAIGDTIKIASAPPFIAYNISAEVTALVVNPTSFDVTVASPYTVNNPLYILINRPDYRLEVEIFEFKPASNAFLSVAKSLWRPDPKGLALVDVSAYIGKDMDHRNASAYNVRNWKDQNATSRFYILWREYYTGSAANQYGSPADIYSVAKVAKQVGDQYGQNLGEFIPYADNDAAITNRAKFLTDFEEPTYWPGYPWDIGFVYAETIQGQDITLEEDRIDAGGNVIGHEDDNIDKTQSLAVNRLRPIFPSDSPAYAGQVAALKIWLELGGVSVEDYVAEDYVLDGYTATVPPVAPGPVTPYRITEEKTIRVNQACHASPVYLSWCGPLGRNYWLFDGVKTYNTPSKSLGDYQNEPLDLATAEERERNIGRSSGDVIKLGAIVDGNDYRGLKTIAGSPFVQLWTGSGWKTVSVKNASFDYDTKEDRAEVKIEIELPEFYNTVN